MTDSQHTGSGVEAAPDRIVIHDLRVPAHVGVLDSEHGRAQELRFDVEMDTVPGYLDQVHATGRYVSYADTVTFIQDKAATGAHVPLVETWAAEVAAFALANPLVARVAVTVTKTEIFAAAGGVGIRIVRRRE
jgi:dihydroneopterin aldolase